MMKVLVALSLVAAATAACESLAPAASDPSRPSLFGSPAPATPARQEGWMPLARTPRDGNLLSPYPSRQSVLDQQRGLLGQDIRRQETSRNSLGQQLQQGTERDQQDMLRLQQQQLEQQRAGR